MKVQQQHFVVKQNTKRNSKSHNDFNRTFEGRLARKANNAYKARKFALSHDSAF